ncbi:hypothetical protein D3C83_68760 [compost metagenome]
MARQHGVHQLRDHRVFVADDAGKERVFPPQALREVVANLVAHRPAANFPPGDGRFQLSKSVDAWRGRHRPQIIKPGATEGAESSDFLGAFGRLPRSKSR